MIKIYPFKALMPDNLQAAEIACEPYDVISTEEARSRAAGKPNSFLQIVRSEIGLPIGTNPYDSAVYQAAADNLNAFVTRGLLQEVAEPAIYIYRQIMKGRAQHGVVCTCDAQQYRDDLIKKHEKTRPDKEDDRTRHMLTCNAQSEPVFLTFRDTAEINRLIEANASGTPLIDFQADDGVAHTIWQVAEPQKFVDAFARLEALYIADGHHRTAGAERAAAARQQANPKHTGSEEYNRILSVLFPASQLQILAYNRVVKDLHGDSPAEVLDKLKQAGKLSETTNPVPGQAGQICVYLAGKWYLLTIPADSIDSSDPIGSLDVSLLQTRILESVLGVGDPRTDNRLAFVGGIRGTRELEQLVDSGEAAIAFSMFPTSIDQLLNVSDAGVIMPPKSTWFEPKLRSGLFVHRFEPSS
jgi:uncharacterized protein (DUF1015 family)